MYKDERDLLDVLKAELAFLEKGGYGRSPRESWRQPLIFEDSPSCMNYDCKDHPEPCSSCALFQLIPPQFRGKQVPCRYIPFNAEGDTLDSLSRFSHQFEIEEVFGVWLRKTIEAIENERQASGPVVNPPLTPRGHDLSGESLSHRLHPKCANPACSTAFRWLAGGKFFRFRQQAAGAHSNDISGHSPLTIPGIEHYWLCERCSHVFTLAFEDGQGVVLKLLWPELLAPELPRQLKAG